MRRLTALLIVFAGTRSAGAAGIFVSAGSGDDAADGLSWATARATVGSALATATATPEPDVVSVGAGVYGERVIVPADVTLLGGFPTGGGTRDPAANPTVIDGGGLGTPVVHFPPGSDGTVLDGFTVRGGFREGDFSGGGILVEDAAPLILRNVIEDNGACRGSGIAVDYTTVRAPARIEANIIRGNGVAFRLSRHECEPGTRTRCGAIDVAAPAGMDLGVILSGNLIIDNEASWGGDVCVQGQARIEHEIISRNSAGLYLSGGPLTVFNVQLTGNFGSGARLECGGSYSLKSMTIADNFAGIYSSAGAATSLELENSILLGGASGMVWACDGAPVVDSSLVEGGHPGGSRIIDADPLFVPGPVGDYYLSQVAAGQAGTSPAVDAGNTSSSLAGLDVRTTATDSSADGGVVDLGYHPERVNLRVMRGTAANALALHRVVAGLPFVDDPGTLGDPTLPVLFYEIAEVENEISVEKDLATNSVRLMFSPLR
jgi:hypothetical protein